MSCTFSNSGRSVLRVSAVLLSLTLPSPAWCYDSYLSQQVIRDAYFLGTRERGLTLQILAKSSNRISEPHQGNRTSEIRLETPFLQVADYTSKVPNYSSQAVVKDSCDKPMRFRVFLTICYLREAAAPNSVKFRFVQNKKEIAPISDTRLAYAEPANGLSNLAANGERAKMESDAQKTDSSMLIIQIHTPDG